MDQHVAARGNAGRLLEILLGHEHGQTQLRRFGRLTRAKTPWMLGFFRGFRFVVLKISGCWVSRSPCPNEKL